MDDILDHAWRAAQKTVGPELWERLPDAVRVKAIYEQICKMDAAQVAGRPLFADNPGLSDRCRDQGIASRG